MEIIFDANTAKSMYEDNLKLIQSNERKLVRETHNLKKIKDLERREVEWQKRVDELTKYTEELTARDVSAVQQIHDLDKECDEWQGKDTTNRLKIKELQAGVCARNERDKQYTRSLESANKVCRRKHLGSSAHTAGSATFGARHVKRSPRSTVREARPVERRACSAAF